MPPGRGAQMKNTLRLTFTLELVVCSIRYGEQNELRRTQKPRGEGGAGVFSTTVVVEIAAYWLFECVPVFPVKYTTAADVF